MTMIFLILLLSLSYAQENEKWQKLIDRGNQALREWETRSAGYYFHQAFDIAKGPKQIAGSHQHLAMYFMEKENSPYTQAEQHFKKAIAIYETIPHFQTREYAKTLDELGLLYYLTNDNENALKFYHKALAVQKKVFPSPHVETLETLDSIGKIYYFQEDYKEAAKFFALAADEITPTYEDEAEIFEYWGKSLSEANYYYQAEEVFQKFIEVSLKKDVSEQADAYSEVGDFYSEWEGDSHKAEAMYKEAIKRYEQIAHLEEECYGLSIVKRSLADALQEQEKYTEAWDVWEWLIDRYSKGYQDLENYSIAKIFLEQVVILQSRNNYKDALSLANQSLKIFIGRSAAGSKRANTYIPDALMAMARSYDMLDNREKLQETCEHAYMLLPLLGNDNEINAMKTSIGKLYTKHNIKKLPQETIVDEKVQEYLNSLATSYEDISPFYEQKPASDGYKTRWLKMANVICRFELSNEFEADKSFFSTLITISKEEKKAAIVIATISLDGSLAEFVKEKSNPRSKGEIIKLGEVECAVVKNYNKKGELFSTSYLRRFGGIALKCSFRHSSDNEIELDLLAKRIIQSMELKGQN